jgi:uncharacterized membrane protein YbhN (UPF0104 family)
VLNIGGIPLGAAVSVSILNFTGTLLFFGTGVAAALVFFQKWIVSGTIRSILWGCAGLFILALLLLSAALFKPSLIKKLSGFIAGILGRISWINPGKVLASKNFIFRKVDEYHTWCLEFLLKKPGVVVLSILLTVVLYLNKFTISWLLARGLGIDVPWAAMFSSLYLITFISYFAPTPGAGGVAEVATGILLAPLISGGILPLFTLLNRMFILFIPAGTGFLATIGTIREVETSIDERA